MEKKKILGIWVEPDIKAEIQHRKENFLVYKTTAGVFQKGHKGRFVTNPAIQRALEMAPRLLGKQIGDIKVRVEERNRVLELWWFYPMGGKVYEPFPKQKKLGRIGVGSSVFYAVIRDLAEEFPDYKIRTAGLHETEMREMLREMGLAAGPRYLPKTILDRSGDYLARELRKRRPLKKSDLAPEKSARGKRERKRIRRPP